MTTLQANAYDTTQTPVTNSRLMALKSELHEQVIRQLDLTRLATAGDEELRRDVRSVAQDLLRNRRDLISYNEQEQLINEVLDEMFGLGALEPLMRDPEITDILINGPKTVYIERHGKLEHRSDIAFRNDQHLIQIVQRIVGRIGRRVDETRPMVDARLPDGSRINAVIPPLAIDGPLVSIRRFGAHPLTIKELLDKQSVTPEMIQFCEACIKAKLNMLISGGTGTGKTTLLNALSAFIPHEERLVTIEDAAELKLQQPHVGRMEIRPPNIEGMGEITTRDLVRNSLRMRPDRIIVGECRGPEALDMLQALNTGHEGSLTTIHANDTRDALSRLEMMVGMAGFDVPMWIIRRQMASALHIVIHLARMSGGARKIVKISEVTGMEGEVILMHDIFVFKQTGVDKERNAVGEFWATGIRPKCLDRLEVSGFGLPVTMFEERVLHAGR